MARLILFFCIVAVAYASEKNQQISYDDLPEGNYTKVSNLDIESNGLSGMYVMARGFVNLIWKPFSGIEDYIYQVLNGGDFFDIFSENLNTILNFEVAYIACVSFGILFIILVIFGGLIMCCCRSCCNSCGGNYIQSPTRTKSQWRICHTLLLLFLTVLILLPCIFIFLTNNWLTEVVNKAPQKLKTSLDNGVTYVEVITKQLEHTVDQFQKVNDSITSDLNNIGNEIGVPLRDEFSNFTKPAVDQLLNISGTIKDVVKVINDVDQNFKTFQNDANVLEIELNKISKTMKSQLEALPNCKTNAECQALVNSTKRLTLGSQVSSLNTSDLMNVKTTLNGINISLSISLIETALDEIPGYVANASQKSVNDVIEVLNTAGKELDKISTIIDPSIKSDISKQATDFKENIDNLISVYEPYDTYRIIACFAIGGIILLICVLYFVGIFLGHCSYYPDPENRDCSSKFGGLLLMSGVGFTFIFAWILMLLVIVLFTIGGHSEKYICQGVEKPYEILKFADRFLEDTKIDVNGQPQNLSVYKVVSGCEENKSLYEVLNLETIFNITEMTKNISSKLEGFGSVLENMTIDLSALSVYTNETEDKLNSMTSTGIEKLNFTSLVGDMKDAVFNLNLTGYIEYLKSTAASTSFKEMATLIDGYVTNITDINNTFLPPLSADATKVENSVSDLDAAISKINMTVGATKKVMKDLDVTLQTNGTNETKKQLIKLGNNLVNDANSYINWVVEQVTDNIGACRPVYDIYDQAVTTVCSYFVDVLSGLWFALGWCVFFLIPASIVAMKLAKFYRGGQLSYDEDMNEQVELHEYTTLPQKSYSMAQY